MLSRRTVINTFKGIRATRIQSCKMHQSSLKDYPAVLSDVSQNTTRPRHLSESTSHLSTLSSRPPLHQMKKFTPMQLTCNFQTTPPKPNAPLLVVIPQIQEAELSEIYNIPLVNSSTRSSSGSEFQRRTLISTSNGDATHVSSPSGIAHILD